MRFAQQLPTTVEIDGTEYPINWDFRAAVQFEILLEEETDDAQIVFQMLSIFYGDVPENILAAVNKALEFYAGGEEKEKNQEKTGKTKPYSFRVDWDYLYAAFLEQYGIDLQDAPLHWWKFRAMFQSLSSNTKFGEIVGYRTIQLSGKMSREHRDFYRKMKKEYALPKANSKEQKRVEEIRQKLKNGGSIEDILLSQGSDEN